MNDERTIFTAIGLLCGNDEMDASRRCTLSRDPLLGFRKFNGITASIVVSFGINTRVMMKTFWTVKYRTEY
jgi:hypothetical protein